MDRAEASLDRRRYPRIKAHIIYRPAGLALFHHWRSAVDVSAGGMRAVSDEKIRVGRRLEMELLLGGGSTIRCWARVVWLDELPAGSPSRYEVGMQFIDVEDANRARLAAILADSSGPD